MGPATPCVRMTPPPRCRSSARVRRAVGRGYRNRRQRCGRHPRRRSSGPGRCRRRCGHRPGRRPAVTVGASGEAVVAAATADDVIAAAGAHDVVPGPRDDYIPLRCPHDRVVPAGANQRRSVAEAGRCVRGRGGVGGMGCGGVGAPGCRGVCGTRYAWSGLAYHLVAFVGSPAKLETTSGARAIVVSTCTSTCMARFLHARNGLGFRGPRSRSLPACSGAEVAGLDDAVSGDFPGAGGGALGVIRRGRRGRRPGVGPGRPASGGSAPRGS